MMKKIALFIILFTAFGFLKASDSTLFSNKKNVISVELASYVSNYSLNYERVVLGNKNYSISCKAGAGVSSDGRTRHYMLQGGLFINFGTGKHHLQAGIQRLFEISPCDTLCYSYAPEPGSFYKNTSYSKMLYTGYRFQKPAGKMCFQAGLSVGTASNFTYNRNYFKTFISISLGYCFGKTQKQK